VSERPAELTISHKEIAVQRVVVCTSAVDENYARVELVIDGDTFEMSRPEAQHLAQVLYRAGAGPNGELGAA
jgi:hypothetical protein